MTPTSLDIRATPTATYVRPDHTTDDHTTWTTTAGDLTVDTSRPTAGPQILLEHHRITRGEAAYLRDALTAALATPDPALERFAPEDR